MSKRWPVTRSGLLLSIIETRVANWRGRGEDGGKEKLPTSTHATKRYSCVRVTLSTLQIPILFSRDAHLIAPHHKIKFPPRHRLRNRLRIANTCVSLIDSIQSITRALIITSVDNTTIISSSSCPANPTPK